MKSQQEILTELHSIFHHVFRDATINITPETTADDIRGWDSLTHMTLIAEVEKHFGCEFSFSEVMNFENVGDMVRAIQLKKD